MKSDHCVQRRPPCRLGGGWNTSISSLPSLSAAESSADSESSSRAPWHGDRALPELPKALWGSSLEGAIGSPSSCVLPGSAHAFMRLRDDPGCGVQLRDILPPAPSAFRRRHSTNDRSPSARCCFRIASCNCFSKPSTCSRNCSDTNFSCCSSALKRRIVSCSFRHSLPF